MPPGSFDRRNPEALPADPSRVPGRQVSASIRRRRKGGGWSSDSCGGK
jgi:hypothetical protein